MPQRLERHRSKAGGLLGRGLPRLSWSPAGPMSTRRGTRPTRMRRPPRPRRLLMDIDGRTGTAPYRCRRGPAAYRYGAAAQDRPAPTPSSARLLVHAAGLVPRRIGKGLSIAVPVRRRTRERHRRWVVLRYRTRRGATRRRAAPHSRREVDAPGPALRLASFQRESSDWARRGEAERRLLGLDHQHIDH
jgi:hypothetical protein